jgi:DNA repair exonuclease SbcCD nuclease subunit
MRFRFVHAADLHLDTPFEGLAQVSPEAAALLRDASLRAFDAVVRLAVERDAALVLLAGDLYDGEERGVRAQLRFLQGVERLAGHGIRTFVVHGNHDPLGGWSAIRHWPAEVTIFGSEEVVGVPVEIAGRQAATVFGLSYARRDVTENLALRFPPDGERDPEEGLRIGLLHCSVGDQPDHSPYSPCSLADLGRAGIEYWALGHVHRSAVLQEGGPRQKGKPWVVYSGNTQGRSPKPAETGAKGVVVVEVDGSVVRSVEFVPVDPVRFVHVSLEIGSLSEVTDLGGLRSELLRKVLESRERNEGRALLVRATLEGRGPLHRDLASPGAAADLLRDLQDSLSDADPPIFWESVRDRTRPQIDLDVVRARDDFASNLLALADTVRDDPVRLEELTRLVSPAAPADLARRCRAPGAGDMARLLEEASLLAVDALETEDHPCE